MLIKSKQLKEISQKILQAVDSSSLSILTETLQLKTSQSGEYLHVSVTNKEYFADVRVHLPAPEHFHATVNAQLFLKLVSQITTERIELNVEDNYLHVKGNGAYKLPLIFDNDKLLELPEIIIDNPTAHMTIDSEILSSILYYNIKELTKGHISNPLQKFCYVDEKGAITFTTGACVNSFALPKPIKLLLNEKIIKLFKLFNDTPVQFTLGYDALSDDIIQTKVSFSAADVTITSILSCDDTMLKAMPVDAIRSRVETIYPYSINIDKDNLLQTINRLLLFSMGLGTQENIKTYGKFEFATEGVTIWDVNGDNFETIPYTNSIRNMDNTYMAYIDLMDLKATLETCGDKYVILNFGDGQAVVLARAMIKNVIPECSLV